MTVPEFFLIQAWYGGRGSFLTHCVTNLFVNCLKERIIFLFSIYRQWPGKSFLILMTLENLLRMGYFCASKYFRSFTKTFLLCWQIFFSLNTEKECKDLKVQDQPHRYLIIWCILVSKIHAIIPSEKDFFMTRTTYNKTCPNFLKRRCKLCILSVCFVQTI